MKNNKIIAILGEDSARFVGGYVRDFLLGKESSDIDIATVYPPKKVTELLEQSNIKVIPTGIEHGTVTAVIKGKNFEITTLRKDISCDGRHAKVEFTDDWQEDAARRDFTCNALFMDTAGKIYDYFNGQSDLKKGIIRFVGNPAERINEDYLRILRLFRFHAYYGKGEIIAEQIKACSKCAVGIEQLSGERIQTEMLKILSAPEAFSVLEKMKDAGVLEYIIPKDLLCILTPPPYPPRKREGKPLIRLASIIDADREGVQRLAARWKLSNNDRKYLLSLLFSGITADLDIRAQKKILRKLGKKLFTDAAQVSWAKDTNSDSFKAMTKLAEEWEIPTFLLSGDDILNSGIGEGKEVGALLKKAEEYWESNDYKTTKKELLQYIGL